MLHTKLWIADTSHFYIGSANMDWQSLRQVQGGGRGRRAGTVGGESVIGGAVQGGAAQLELYVQLDLLNWIVLVKIFSHP